MHTRETDGRATLEEMAEAARALGYEYIAITDHSKSLAMANGLDEKRAVAFAQAVREMNQDGLGIRVFSGLECDILRDGAMDLAEDALAELDFVIGSVHSYMNLEPAEMTDRLLRALESRTARARPSHGPHAAASRSVSRSISSAWRRRRRGATCVWRSTRSPERLDLHGPLLRTAKAKGAKFVIATDAHHPKHLLNMPFGVMMARRGWLEARDVMNTLPLAGVRKSDSQIMKIISSVEKYKNDHFP